MKVVAINCYQKDEDVHGGEKILGTFMEALSNSGAKTQEIVIRNSKIDDCRKCTERIDFTPPKEHCYQNDGMNELYPSIAEADVWLFAFEHYLASPNDLLQVFIDRLEPLFRLDDSQLSTPIKGKIALISSCAFWDADTFIPVIEEFKEFAKLYSKEFAGQILVPGLLQKSDFEEEHNPILILDAVRSAAKHLVSNGVIPPEMQETINKELIEKKKNKFVETI